MIDFGFFKDREILFLKKYSFFLVSYIKNKTVRKLPGEKKITRFFKLKQ